MTTELAKVVTQFPATWQWSPAVREPFWLRRNEKLSRVRSSQPLGSVIV